MFDPYSVETWSNEGLIEIGSRAFYTTYAERELILAVQAEIERRQRLDTVEN